MSLRPEQVEILIGAGYEEHFSKSGLWLRKEGGFVRYVDFRAEPRAYKTGGGGIESDSNPVLHAVLALREGQRKVTP